MTTTRPAYIFRISPADHCIVEWRRNKVGASWLYWCSRPSEEEALAALLAIQQAGLTIERQEAES